MKTILLLSILLTIFSNSTVAVAQVFPAIFQRMFGVDIATISPECEPAISQRTQSRIETIQASEIKEIAKANPQIVDTEINLLPKGHQITLQIGDSVSIDDLRVVQVKRNVDAKPGDVKAPLANERGLFSAFALVQKNGEIQVGLETAARPDPANGLWDKLGEHLDIKAIKRELDYRFKNDEGNLRFWKEHPKLIGNNEELDGFRIFNAYTLGQGLWIVRARREVGCSLFGTPTLQSIHAIESHFYVNASVLVRDGKVIKVFPEVSWHLDELGRHYLTEMNRLRNLVSDPNQMLRNPQNVMILAVRDSGDIGRMTQVYRQSQFDVQIAEFHLDKHAEGIFQTPASEAGLWMNADRVFSDTSGSIRIVQGYYDAATDMIIVRK